MPTLVRIRGPFCIFRHGTRFVLVLVLGSTQCTVLGLAVVPCPHLVVSRARVLFYMCVYCCTL